MSKYLVHKAVELGAVQKKFAPTNEELGAFLVQPKHDGCNMIAVVHAWSEEGITLYSRTGEVVRSAEHIKTAFVMFATTFGLPTGAYLGEYWHPELPINQISGKFRDTKRQHPEMQFVVFDYLNDVEWVLKHSALNYLQRTSRIPFRFYEIDPERAPIYPVQSEGTLSDLGLTPGEAALQMGHAGKYDGIIMRNPMGTWTAGSGTTGEILKFKPLLTLDLRVVGFEPGRGKYSGQIGTLLVSYGDKVQGAGTGLKDSQRECAEFQENWYGKIVEITCLGITEDGYLREPRLGEIRYDKLEPDV